MSSSACFSNSMLGKPLMALVHSQSCNLLGTLSTRTIDALRFQVKKENLHTQAHTRPVVIRSECPRQFNTGCV